jgi:hypothetical protein
VADEIIAEGADRSVQILLHTPPDGAFVVDGARLSGDESTGAGSFNIRRSDAQVRVDMLGPEDLQITHNVWPDSSQYGHYVSASTGEKHAELWNLTALQPGPPARDIEPIAGTLTPTDSGCAINLQLPDGTARLIAIGASGEGRLHSDGAAAMVADDTTEGYALCDGASLSFDDQQLVSATAPVTAGAALEAGVFTAVIDATETASVTIQTPEDLTMVRVLGLDQPVDISYDDEDGLMTLSVPPGRYTIQGRPL